MSQINSTVLDTISANVDATEKNFKPILTSNITTSARTSTTTTTITTTLISKTPSTTAAAAAATTTTTTTTPAITTTTTPAITTTTAELDIGIPIVTSAHTEDKTSEIRIVEEAATSSSNDTSTMTGQVLHSATNSNTENGTVINLNSPAATGSGIAVGVGVTSSSSSASSGSTYKIVKTLGKGNFAKVKLAVHVPTGREVAIKIIDKTQLNASAQQKLHREVGIMKMLNHPNIVRLYQVIETDRTLYLVMEYACKGELFDYLVKNGRMKERDARSVFRQLVSAIQYCHSKFVVHRDLKAENLLLDQRMNIKIADFGFGNTYDPKSHLETFCGSPPYAAPELFMGRKYAGPEADSWSLGVVLYTLVSGTLPFDGGTLKELRERVLRGKYRVPYYISMDCENLMRKFLVLNPTKRTTLTAVMGDKWLNAGHEQSEWLRPYRESPPLLNDQTRIELLVAMGYKRQDVEVSIKQQRFDDIYCTYLLLNVSKSRRVNSQESKASSMSPMPSSSLRAVAPRVANNLAEPQTASGPPAKPTRRSVCKSPAPTLVQSRTDSGLPKPVSSSPLPVAKRPGMVDVKPTLLSAQRKLAQQQKHQHLQSTPTKLTSGAGSNGACTPPPRSLRPSTLYEKAAVESPSTLSFGPAVSKVSMDPSIIDRLKLSGGAGNFGGSVANRPHSPDLKKSVTSSKSFARNSTRATFHFGQARSGKQQCSGDSDAVLGYPNTPPLSADDTKPAARIGFFSKLTARFGRRTLHEKEPLDQRKNVTK